MASTLPPPPTIGRYRIERRIGGGGMASVYRARPPEDLIEAIGAPIVAIKTLHPEFASDPEFRAMFEEEAEISGQVEHPNVVALFDFGQTNEGALFLVMEWVDGMDLGEVLRSFRRRRLRMTPPLACAIVEQALRGLHAAHSRADRDGNPLVVVHRDVSPANVLLSTKGEVKIADFGLARPLHRVRRTLPGIVKGKFAYLAPEQTYDRMVDPRTDVFAAAIVLWEALASRHLFRRSTDLKTVLAVREGQTRPIERYAPGIDVRVSMALERALQVNPDHRYESAAAFADALAEYLASEPKNLYGAKALGALLRDVRDAESHPTDRGTEPSRVSRLSLPRVVKAPPLPPRAARSSLTEPMPLVRARTGGRPAIDAASAAAPVRTPPARSRNSRRPSRG